MEDKIFYWIAGFALASALLNLAGILAIVKYREWAEKSINYFICLAAGMLVSASLMIAFPKAVLSNPKAGFLAIAGFLFMFFSNKLIKRHTGQRELAFGITAAEGIGIHSFIDGVIYTVTFNVSILTGVLSAMGLVVHEFAEGVLTYLFLSKGGIQKKKAVFYAFLISGLTTPLGAFMVYPFVSQAPKHILGLMLGFVAGVLLYVSAAHLLPEAGEHEKKHSTIAFLGGVGIALFLLLSK